MSKYVSDQDWLKMPEWESDEHVDTKTIAWATLTDAMMKSIMTNDPERGKVLTSVTAAANMVESRLWLMDDDEHGGISRHGCLYVLNISDMVLKQLLRHLWLRWDKRIGDTMWKSLKTARAAIKRETRRNASGIRGPKKMKAAREHAILMRASDVRRVSNEWVEE